MTIRSTLRLPLIRHIRVRPRLAIAVAVGCLLWFLLPEEWRAPTRLLVAWDSCILLYLMLAAVMMARSPTEKIRRRAALEDEGRIAILILTTVSAAASLAATVAELAVAKTLAGDTRWQHIALAGMTVILSWTFMQTIFALHYAHEYYSDYHSSSRALEFPAKCLTPDYWDFAYFAFVIGTAAQTADVNVASPMLRRVVALHCIVVFFFNTMILALTVNIGASLF